MATSRFFLADLPLNTAEQDLKHIFQDYGEVTKVEIKTKENLVDPGQLKTIAFVTLKIDDADVQYCLKDLNWQKINGSKLKVSLAKESFLERLKREREEAEAEAHASRAASSCITERSADQRAENVVNTRKRFKEDLELNDNDDDDGIPPELLITKKRATTSIHNGKIVIQASDSKPIHVINNKQPGVRQRDEKSAAAEQKRKQSLKQKMNQYEQQKTAVQQALAIQKGNASKKIKFSASEDEDETSREMALTGAKKKLDIFASDDGEDEDTEAKIGLKLKPEYFGKKGEKLVQLQGNQSMDPRFKIDAKFVDEDDDRYDEAEDNKRQPEIDNDNERDWQMGILEQVVGVKLDTPADGYREASKHKKMLRFDPSKDDHQKFLRAEVGQLTSNASTTAKKPKNKKLISQTEGSKESAAPEVSKEIFYTVSDSLAKSLKTHSEGFSLLSMFGSAAENKKERGDKLEKVAHEKILISKVGIKTFNPFSYDSSSESEEDAVAEVEAETVNSKKQKQKKPGAKRILLESFFIPKNDARLKEGAEFFKYEKKPETEENYQEVRNRLNLLIKAKIAKSRKQLLGGKRKGKSKA